jgi:hypothetical protein
MAVRGCRSGHDGRSMRDGAKRMKLGLHVLLLGAGAAIVVEALPVAALTAITWLWWSLGRLVSP